MKKILLLVSFFAIASFSFGQVGIKCDGCSTTIVNQQGGVSQIGINGTGDTLVHNDGNGLITNIPLLAALNKDTICALLGDFLTVSTGNDSDPLNATQTANISCDDFIHFYSSDGSIDFGVTQGSGLVDFTFAGKTALTTFGFTNADLDLLAFPPAQPANAPADADSLDTRIHRYSNGYAYYTHNGTDWTLNLFQSSDDVRSRVRDQQTSTYVAGSLANPLSALTGQEKGGDVLIEPYANGIVWFTYQSGGVGAGYDGNNSVFVPFPVDTYGTVKTATAFFNTTNGTPVSAGSQYIEFPDGTTYDINNATVATALLPFTTTNGVDVEANDIYIQFQDGTTWSTDETCTLAKEENYTAGPTNNSGGQPGPSGTEVGTITLDQPSVLTITHTISGAGGGTNGSAGIGISTTTLPDDANVIALSVPYSTTGDRVNATTPSKTYTTTVIPAGTYYIGVFSGGGGFTGGHQVDIIYNVEDDICNILNDHDDALESVSDLIAKDSTEIFQDSILIAYRNGVEINRDTIRFDIAESGRETSQEQCFERPFSATVIDHSTLDPTGNNVVMESVLCDHVTTFSVQQGFSQFSANATGFSRLKPGNTGGVFGQFTFNKPTDVTFRLQSLGSNEFIQFRSTDLHPFDGTAPWDSQTGNILPNAFTVHNNNGGPSFVTFLGVQEVNVFFSNTNSNNPLSSNYQLTVNSTHDALVRTYVDADGNCELVSSDVCDCTDLTVVTQAEVDTWTVTDCLSDEDLTSIQNLIDNSTVDITALDSIWTVGDTTFFRNFDGDELDTLITTSVDNNTPSCIQDGTENAFLQLDGTYLTESDVTVSIEDVLTGSWEPCVLAVEEVCPIVVSNTPEPLDGLTGTLSDGTTWTITNDQSPTATTSFATSGNGDIAWDNSSDITITFSAPVQLEVRPTTGSIAPIGNPIVWQLTNGGPSTIITAGDSVIYTPGIDDVMLLQPNIQELQGTIQTTVALSPRANDPWGVVVAYNTTQIVFEARDLDAYNFTAKTISEDCGGSTESAINDQSSSGYIDIGEMRMSWGIVSGGSGIATFPNGGFSNNPVVTMSPITSTLREVRMDNLTNTSIDLFQGGTGDIHWQAIGLKPN